MEQVKIFKTCYWNELEDEINENLERLKGTVIKSINTTIEQDRYGENVYITIIRYSSRKLYPIFDKKELR